MLRLFNSLTKQIEETKPHDANEVSFYMCGPTVYNYLHIGNLRTLVLGDILRRALESQGLKINYVMNITDVGHMTSDGDTGEDKMEKNAKSAEEVMAVAQKYTDAFLEDIAALNILPASKYPKASEHVADQIEMIKTLIDKGFAYESDEAVYFDVSKFPNYNQLTGQKLEDMLLGARQEVVADPKKKNPIDFVLWFKAQGRYANHILRWPSPWGEGFPGWHIECSAMSLKYLRQPIDIHAGGVDLKFPHHTNEIAQSEAATGRQFVKTWIHGEHLLVDKSKMSKSLNNFFTLKDIVEKGYNPLAFRYLILTTHYRSKLNFSWDSLGAAQNALNNLYTEVSTYDPANVGCAEYEKSFQDSMENDLDTPQALAVMWDMIRSEYPTSAKLRSLIKFDQVLGLKIREVWEAAKTVPDVVRKLVDEREEARNAKDWVRADELRRAIESNGYLIEDTVDGIKVKKAYK